MTTEEIIGFELVMEEIVRKAVTAADRVILDGCRGNTEALAFLTAEVAQEFAAKTALMLRHEIYLKEMLCEVPPEILNKGH
jgi:hypothetical protein